jgi:hypothetical protein
VNVEESRERAGGIRHYCQESFRGAADGVTFISQNGMDDDSRQKAEGRKPDGRQKWEWALDSHLGELVRGKRTQIPRETKQRRNEEEWIEPRSKARRPSRANDHREQHRVEHDAGTESDEVQQLADVQGGRHGTSVSDG